MSDTEILGKAVKIAEGHGYRLPWNIPKRAELILTKEIIFDHAFAKAFFGEWQCIGADKTNIPVPIPIKTASQSGSGVFIWQWHLQQMVIEANPLKYLEQFLVTNFTL